MELFLRIETSSNILGSSDTNITYIALTEVTSVSTDYNGGSTVYYGDNSEINVPGVSPDSLMQSCIVSVGNSFTDL